MSEFEKVRMKSGVGVGRVEVGAMDERSVDETLRMIARMPVPERLEERVKAGLQLAEKPGRVLGWPAERRGESVGVPGGWMRAGWARGAAAAAIALVVVGGGWGIYARVEPAQSAKIVAMPAAKQNGAFSEAGAMRRPQTLVGPTVKPKPAAPKAGRAVIHSQVSTTRPGAPGVGQEKSTAVAAQGSASRVSAPLQ
jgi:hypothetical protein